jgi:T5SS/PEP-CTERM-associated repeat protein/autotransporter-associated beta strand protein
VTVNGAGSTWTNSSDLTVGGDGIGKLNITGGGAVSNTIGTIGASSGSNGSVTVDGVGSTWTTGGLSVRLGRLDITGGGVVTSTGASIRSAPGSNGTVTVDGVGSTWTDSNILIVGSSGTGTLNIQSGGVVIAPQLDGNATSNINLDSGTLRIAGGRPMNPINLLAGGGTLDVSTFTLGLFGEISGVGGLTKMGGATLSLRGANSYSGNTIVSNGVLRLLGNGSFASSPVISVGTGAVLQVLSTGGANFDGVRFALVSGQTLKGIGAVSGDIDISAGASIAPGNSVGTLATDGLTFAGGSTLELEIDLGATPDADLLNVTGGINLSGATLDLSLLNATPLTSPQTFLIALNDGTDAITGTFGEITGLPPNWSATVNYAYSGTDFLGRVGTGNDLAITVLPEPGAAALAACGAVLVSIVASRRRGRRRRPV